MPLLFPGNLGGSLGQPPGGGGGAAFTTLVDHDFGATAQQTVSWSLAGYDYFLIRVQQLTNVGATRLQVAASGPTWRTSGYERHGVSNTIFSEVSESGVWLQDVGDTELNWEGELHFASAADYFTSFIGDGWAGGGANTFRNTVTEYATAEAHTHARLHDASGNMTAGRLIVVGVKKS